MLSHLLSLKFAVTILLFVACATNVVAAAEEKTSREVFKIGALLCLTGGCAEVGTNALNGAKLAVDEINQAGGILGRQVELVVQDTREAESGANAVSALQNLLLDKSIEYVVGPTWTSGGLPLVPIMKQKPGVIITSPSLGVAAFNESSEYLFNLWPRDSNSTSALARYAIDKGWLRGAVFSNQGPWESVQAKTFSDEFVKLGGTIVASVEPIPDSRDLRAEALKIKGSNPQVVFLSNYTQMDIAARELERLHFKGNVLAILMDDTRIQGSNGALNGTIFTRYSEPKGNFSESFTARFGHAPRIAADAGYDVVMLYRAAIETAKTTDTTIIKSKMFEVQYTGASGLVVFDAKGGVIKSPQFWVVKDSKQVFLENPQ